MKLKLIVVLSLILGLYQFTANATDLNKRQKAKSKIEIDLNEAIDGSEQNPGYK